MGDPGDEDTAVQELPLPRTFTPSRVGDLTDEALLPARFELLAREVRLLAGIIERKVVPALERIVGRLDEDNIDIGRHGRVIARHEGEIVALRDRVDEAHSEILKLVAIR